MMHRIQVIEMALESHQNHSIAPSPSSLAENEE